jgi:uncharacterized protein YceK
MKKVGVILLGIICIVELSACATFNMLNSDLPLPQRLFIYSGTRLDWAAITNNEAALKRFKVDPPCEPLIDLPFSFALDSILLPNSIYAEIFH